MQLLAARMAGAEKIQHGERRAFLFTTRSWLSESAAAKLASVVVDLREGLAIRSVTCHVSVVLRIVIETVSTPGGSGAANARPAYVATVRYLEGGHDPEANADEVVVLGATGGLKSFWIERASGAGGREIEKGGAASGDQELRELSDDGTLALAQHGGGCWPCVVVNRRFGKGRVREWKVKTPQGKPKLLNLLGVVGRTLLFSFFLFP